MNRLQRKQRHVGTNLLRAALLVHALPVALPALAVLDDACHYRLAKNNDADAWQCDYVTE